MHNGHILDGMTGPQRTHTPHHLFWNHENKAMETQGQYTEYTHMELSVRFKPSTREV